VSLFRKAREAADVVAASLFVNPTQFGPGEDYERYPADAERDERLCRNEGVDLLFRPTVREMYAPGHSVYVEEGELASGLCGARRPGHFRGVLTVVAKLFHIVQPDVAVFGQKDAQQVRLVLRMVRDLDFPLRVEVAPTVREPDGLALSSRNVYLSPAERRRAVCLSEALRWAERLYAQGVRSTADIVREMRERIAGGDPPVDVEYIEAVDWETLKPVGHAAGETLIALAVRIGRTRLIDNAILRG
jgi:pantoate--beta-alanine ligase